MSQPLPSSPPPRKGPSCLVIVLGILGGGTLLVVLLCGGTIFWFTRVPRGSGAAHELFVYDQVPVPAFPEDRGEPIPTEDNPSLTRLEISLGEQGGYYGTPGHGGLLWLYLPPGEHPPKSLPCVLICASRYDATVGAGLNLLDETEHATFAKAGIAVVAYELDGRNDAEMFDQAAQRRQFAAFRDSCGGLVNARNALEYALARMPEVDPQRIYAAGNFLGGTHSLLFAAHEPRLAGVMAMESDVDIPADDGAFLMRARETEQPGFIDFANQISPVTHQQRIKCPTFIYHVDAEIEIAPHVGTEAFVAALKRQGTDLTYENIKAKTSGQKEEGLAASIKWLRKRSGLD